MLFDLLLIRDGNYVSRCTTLVYVNQTTLDTALVRFEMADILKKIYALRRSYLHTDIYSKINTRARVRAQTHTSSLQGVF
jgi:hypothetical protein